MLTESYTFTCDLPGCPLKEESEHFNNAPDGWITIEGDLVVPINGHHSGTNHFCTWRHAAEFCVERSNALGRRPTPTWKKLR